MLLAEILDVIAHSSSSAAARRRASAQVRTLYRPMTTEEVVRELGVSKPTVLKWLRVGLLRETAGSKPTVRLFDRDQIMGARAILQKTKLKGTPRERAEQLADLRERLGWAASGQLEAIRASVKLARAGTFTRISKRDMARGEKLWQAQRAAEQRKKRP